MDRVGVPHGERTGERWRQIAGIAVMLVAASAVIASSPEEPFEIRTEVAGPTVELSPNNPIVRIPVTWDLSESAAAEVSEMYLYIGHNPAFRFDEPETAAASIAVSMAAAGRDEIEGGDCRQDCPRQFDVIFRWPHRFDHGSAIVEWSVVAGAKYPDPAPVEGAAIDIAVGRADHPGNPPEILWRERIHVHENEPMLINRLRLTVPNPAIPAGIEVHSSPQQSEVLLVGPSGETIELQRVVPYPIPTPQDCPSPCSFDYLLIVKLNSAGVRSGGVAEVMVSASAAGTELAAAAETASRTEASTSLELPAIEPGAPTQLVAIVEVPGTEPRRLEDAPGSFVLRGWIDLMVMGDLPREGHFVRLLESFSGTSSEWSRQLAFVGSEASGSSIFSMPGCDGTTGCRLEIPFEVATDERTSAALQMTVELWYPTVDGQLSPPTVRIEHAE